MPNNPPAFPTPYFGENVSAIGGMSLRDYFAAKAITGIMAFGRYAEKEGGPTLDINQKAKYAFEIANAMLKERENYEKS